MGWDAYSDIELEWNDKNKRVVIIDKEKRVIFEQATQDVIKEVGLVDVLLKIGGLDTNKSRIMLETATSADTYDEEGWDAEFVKKLNKEADWDFKINKKDLWAYLSAKKFLEICATLNLNIYFSW